MAAFMIQFPLSINNTTIPQFAVVAVPASRNYSTFADLKLGRSAQTVVGRILRHWDARNFKRQGKFMGVVFLLLDEQVELFFYLLLSKEVETNGPLLRSSMLHCQREAQQPISAAPAAASWNDSCAES